MFNDTAHPYTVSEACGGGGSLRGHRQDSNGQSLGEKALSTTFSVSSPVTTETPTWLVARLPLNGGVKGLAQGPNSNGVFLLWLDWDLNHQPQGSQSYCMGVAELAMHHGKWSRGLKGAPIEGNITTMNVLNTGYTEPHLCVFGICLQCMPCWFKSGRSGEGKAGFILFSHASATPSLTGRGEEPDWGRCGPFIFKFAVFMTSPSPLVSRRDSRVSGSSRPDTATRLL
ncbi:hypothetical protein JZ751_007227 [Albula glossodonta]|uniref:Uncharacterized protein n=1 Tax=Albula glossodonta TaxID=121402 RepID=A0A8T2NAH7_9TELE|nr:hypothetical protein JZ751_007227 [Albula glossodonta]